MFKKSIVMILSVLLLFSMTACGKKGGSPSLTALTDEQAASYIALANDLSDKLTLRKYDEVYATFDAAMQKALPEDKLKAVWLQTAGNIGKFEKITNSVPTVAEGFPVVTDTLRFTSRSVAVRYTFTTDNKLTGLWMSYANVLPTPVSTDKFDEENITVTTDSYSMNGLLTLPKAAPKGMEKPPIVILVQGSGQSDLDETIGMNKPFMDLAHGLADKGVAVLRYDKRYYALPERVQEDVNSLTIYGEIIDDVNSAIALAQKDTRLNGERIYVLGHSLGGMLAPKIAADNKAVAGIISMAGTLRRMQDIILTQNEEVIAAEATLTDEEKAAMLDEVKKILKAADNADPASTDLIAQWPPSYWDSMNKLDMKAIAKGLTVPMLILQGSADFQISPSLDFPVWEETLGKRDNVTYKLYDGLNHMMMETSGKRDVTEYDTKGNVAQPVIDDIAAFVTR